MTTDARISTGLPHHPKTKKLIRRLGESGAWNLICLFLWAAQNRPDGDLSGMDDEDIEIAAGFTGEPAALVQTLCEIRFLEGEPGARKIHDWSEHNPWAAGAKSRSDRGKFAALCKQYGKKQASTMMPEYVLSLQQADQQSANSTLQASNKGANSKLSTGFSSAPSPSPSPSPSPYREKKSQKQECAPDGATPPRNSVPRPDDIDPQVWSDFLAHRRGKKAKLTPSAWATIRREIDAGVKSGHDPNAMLSEAMAAGWQGFKLGWYENRIAGQGDDRGTAKSEAQEWLRGCSR